MLHKVSNNMKYTNKGTLLLLRWWLSCIILIFCELALPVFAVELTVPELTFGLFDEDNDQNRGTTYPKVALISFHRNSNENFTDQILQGLNSVTITSNKVDHLQFSCDTTYPTKWEFQRPLIMENSLKWIKISKNRTTTAVYASNSSNVYRYQSKLLLAFKYSTSIPTFTCKGVQTEDQQFIGEGNSRDLRSTVIWSTISEFRITLEARAQYSKRPPASNITMGKTRNGHSKTCLYKLAFANNQFECRAQGRDVAPMPVQLTECHNMDECYSLLPHNAYSCSWTSEFTRNDGSDNLRAAIENLKGSGIISCGRDRVEEAKYIYFPSGHKTSCTDVDTFYPHDLNVQLSQNVMNILRGLLLIRVDVPVNVKEDVILNFLKSMVHLSSTPEEIYTDQFVTFTCHAPSLVFSLGFDWSYQFDNDPEIHFVAAGTVNEGYKNGADAVQSSTSMTFNGTSVKNIRIMCSAPVVNSDAWINQSLSITLKTPLKPEIVDLTLKKISNSGQETTRVTCVTKGEPSPTFIWMLGIFNATRIFEIEQLKTDKRHIICTKQEEDCLNISTARNGSLTTSVLEWTHDAAKDKGWRLKPYHLACEALNHIGTVTRTLYISSYHHIVTTVICVLVSVIVLAIIAAAIIYRQCRKIKNMTAEEVDTFINGDPHSKDPTLLPYDSQFEIARTQFQIESTVLGEGHFGMVKIGKYQSNIVAIKTLQKNADSNFFKALLGELKVMCYVGSHKHIVGLIGACTENIQKREVFLLLEFCSKGNVRDYIRNCRANFLDRFNADEYRRSVVVYQNGASKTLSTKDLLRWAEQIADGCDFLANRNVIHGDLAARNVLVTDNLDIKVGDFGLSKQLLQYSVYIQNEKRPLPLKWMALESLQDMEFSLQSDIWSYGIVLSELFSLGDVPYPGMDWNCESYKLLKSGYRMERPRYADDNVYSIMMACWDSEPLMRPTFNYLKKCFHDAKLKL